MAPRSLLASAVSARAIAEPGVPRSGFAACARVAKLCRELGDGLESGHGVVDTSHPPWVTLELPTPIDALGVARQLRDRSDDAVALGVFTEVADGLGRLPAGRVARRARQLATAAHPGQLLVVDLTAGFVTDLLAPPARLVALGAHRVYTLERSDPVHHLVEPGHPDDHPPVQPLRERAGNLPLAPVPFVGRLETTETVIEALDASRCVTLMGVGGVGKTRLALHVAGELLPFFEDGAWFVDLAGIADASLIPTVVAVTLGAHVGRADDASAALGALVGGRRILLLLDNCERATSTIGDLVTDLLSRAPRRRS